MKIVIKKINNKKVFLINCMTNLKRNLALKKTKLELYLVQNLNLKEDNGYFH